MPELDSIAQALVGGGKGLLAADETPHTLTTRFDALNIPSAPDSRRDYREMLITTPGIAEFISGVILQDETIHQHTAMGAPLVEVLLDQGIVPGIKVDAGASKLAAFPDETITEGLDGLRDRLANYRQMGARFAKWRAIIHIAPGRPTSGCVQANAHALARYASLCQEQEIVPIVEPEVLMDGTHGIERCEEVTGEVLRAVFDALFELRVRLEGMLLKPNMVLAGKDSRRQASVEEVAQATVRCLRRSAPAAVPGIVFLSGGQDHVEATRHLNAINQIAESKPWKLSFSYGRALQDEALHAWLGKRENVVAAQHAFMHRCTCVGAAARGAYSETSEGRLAA